MYSALKSAKKVQFREVVALKYVRLRSFKKTIVELLLQTVYDRTENTEISVFSVRFGITLKYRTETKNLDCVPDAHKSDAFCII